MQQSHSMAKTPQGDDPTRSGALADGLSAIVQPLPVLIYSVAAGGVTREIFVGVLTAVFGMFVYLVLFLQRRSINKKIKNLVDEETINAIKELCNLKVLSESYLSSSFPKILDAKHKEIRKTVTEKNPLFTHDHMLSFDTQLEAVIEDMKLQQDIDYEEKINLDFERISSEIEDKWNKYFDKHGQKQNIDEETLEFFKTNQIQSLNEIPDANLVRKLISTIEHHCAGFKIKVKENIPHSVEMTRLERAVEFEKLVFETLSKSHGDVKMENSGLADFSLNRNGSEYIIEAKLTKPEQIEKTVKNIKTKWRKHDIEIIGVTELMGGYFITGEKRRLSSGSEFQFA